MKIDVMTIFNAIIVIFGLYMVIAALKMKKSGEISSTVIAQEEIASCRDKNGFIDFMYWREAAFGGIVFLMGVLGLVNDLVISLGKFSLVQMVLFLGAFFWFQHELGKARRTFLS